MSTYNRKKKSKSARYTKKPRQKSKKKVVESDGEESTKIPQPQSDTEKKNDESLETTTKNYQKFRPVSVHYRRERDELTENDKRFFVCMFIQSKNNKTESKIFSTTHPYLLAYKLNMSGTQIPSTINLNVHGDTYEKNGVFSIGAIKGIENIGDSECEGPKLSDVLRNNISHNGSWEIELIIGPFSESDADDFAKSWTSKSRGIDSRRTRGLDIFQERLQTDPNLKCYNKHIVPLSPPIDFWLSALNIDLPEDCKDSQIVKYYSHLKTSIATITKNQFNIDKYRYDDTDFVLKINGTENITNPENNTEDPYGTENCESEHLNKSKEFVTSDVLIDDKIIRIPIQTKLEETYRKDLIKYGSLLSHTLQEISKTDESNKLKPENIHRKYKRKVKIKETVIEMKIPCILCTDPSLKF